MSDHRNITTPGQAPDSSTESAAKTTGGRALTAGPAVDQQLRNTFESIGEGFIACDAQWRFVYLNPQARRLLGVEGVELIGRNHWEVFPGTVGTPLEAEYRRAAAGEERDFENFYAPWGRWFHNRCFPREGGGIAVYFHDITERKRDEERLRRNHDTFYHLIQNNPFGVYVIDADFKLRQVSLGAQKVFNSIHPLLGRDFAEILRIIWTEPFASEAIGRFRRTLETGEPYGAPSTVAQRQDISDIEAYDWRINRITLPDGRFGVVCYFYDLSERQRWEAALRESETRFRELAEAMPQLVWTATADGVVDYYNARAWLYSGFERSEDGSWTWHAVLHPDDMAATLEAWNNAVASGASYEIEHRVKMADQSYRWHLSRAQPSRDPNGTIVKWFGAAIDINDQKTAQELLERKVQERTATLRDTIAELEHFSYTITHDMRAPLRAMQAFGDILREEYAAQLDDAGRDYLRRITEAAGRMDNLIRDALDYSKAVQTELTLEPVDPLPILRGLVESYPQFQPPRAEIDLAKSFPLVRANRAGLLQCFSNLLGNAVKFVAPGVTPRVRVRAETRGNVVRVSIEDNGIGISSDQQERVFVMFQRLSKKYEGTGIGLTLVRKVVERMQGRVGFESEPGRGSRFWLELAAVKPDSPGNHGH